MDSQTKNDIVISAASKVHEDWCLQELSAYFKRAQEELKKTDRLGEVFRNACYKGEQKRNEVDLDVAYLEGHDTEVDTCLSDFAMFMFLFKIGAIDVKRFVNRELTEEEKQKIPASEYVDGKENILRPFVKLSTASKKENLEAAIGAFNVYEQMSKAGISIDDMQNNPEIKNIIGIAIHTDWLKRNMDHPNESLKVPYSQLDEWTQQQDLTVFAALLDVVKTNLEKYGIKKEDGFILPNYEEEEKQLLGIAPKSK